MYEIDQHWEPKLSDHIQFRLCRMEDFNKFMPEATSKMHENALCFNDKSVMNMHGDWYDEDFQNIFISLDYCN